MRSDTAVVVLLIQLSHLLFTRIFLLCVLLGLLYNFLKDSPKFTDPHVQSWN